MEKIKSINQKTLIYVALFIFVISLGLVMAATNNNKIENSTEEGAGQIINLNLVNQIKKQVTTEAGSIFTELSEEAINIGLSQAQLYGAIKQEVLADQTTRMYINWHSLGIPSGNSQLIETLDSPLKSQFRATGTRVDPGEKISAQGDLDGLIAKFLELKEKVKKEEPKHLVQKESEEEEEDDSSPDYGSAGNTSSAGGGTGTGLESDEFSTNTVSSAFEDCEPRIDQGAGLVFKQHRQVETDESGNVVSVGDCVDNGSEAIQRVYECPMVYDFPNRKAYRSYTEYAIVDGEKITVTNCTTDFNESYEIYAKTSTCQPRVDLHAGKTYPQEKLFYTDENGQEQALTECIDAEKAYNIFYTDMTCSNVVDKASKTVTIYKRPAYYMDNGSIAYAGECVAVEKVPIQKEYENTCETIYDFENKKVYEQYREFAIIDGKEFEVTPCSKDALRTYSMYSKPSDCDIRHDFDAGKSYVQEDIYYRGSDGIEVKIKECQDSDIFYEHILTEDTCTLEIDRENNKVTQFKRLAYKKPDGRTEYINECQATGILDLEKTYGEPCQTIYDLEEKKAYEQYREMVVLDDETREITTCTNDFTIFHDIYGKPSDCGIRDDFTTNKSYPQEKLYYTDSKGEEIQITECQDSEVSYNHFSTEMTCTPDVDFANDKVTPFKRTAYYLPNGEIEYASECRAADDGSYPILEDFCTPKYEHNFTTGQSYYRTRDYYIKDATPIYLSECLLSTATSFAHVYNSTSCGVVNDDTKLQSTQNTSTRIETPDGIVVISPCEDKGITVPYVYRGFENREKVLTSSSSWTVPTGVSSVTVFAVAGGNYGGNGSETSSGGDGGGRNGGKGDPYIHNSGYVYHGAGGGGGAGEQTTKTVSVTSGQNISITIGNSNQNTSFGNLVVARYDFGEELGFAVGGDARSLIFGGHGGRGYGDVQLAASTACVRPNSGNFTGACTPGIGGKGYGAGGGGGMGGYSGGHTGYYPTAGGKGASGYMKINWVAQKYRRADGTIYIQD